MNKKMIVLGIAMFILISLFSHIVKSAASAQDVANLVQQGLQLAGGQQQPQESFWVRAARWIAVPIVKMPPIVIVIISVIITFVLYWLNEVTPFNWLWKFASFPFHMRSKFAPAKGPELTAPIWVWVVRIFTLGFFTFMRITNNAAKGPYTSAKGPLVAIYILVIAVLKGMIILLAKFAIGSEAAKIVSGINSAANWSIFVSLLFYAYCPWFKDSTITNFGFVDKEGSGDEKDKGREAKDAADSPTGGTIDVNAINRIKLRCPEIASTLDMYEAALKEKWYDAPDDHPLKLKQRLINVIYEIEEVSRMLGIPHEVIEAVMTHHENKRLKRK